MVGEAAQLYAGVLLMPPYGLFSPSDIPHEPKAVIAGRLETDLASFGRLARASASPAAISRWVSFKAMAFWNAAMAAS